MLKSDKIVSPTTHKKIGKYESAWWKLIRLGWHEDYLERLEVIEIQPVFISRSKNMHIKHLSTIVRAGVIMMTTLHDQRLYGFGVDKTYNQLTDFAGGVKKYENAIEAALREFSEETYGLFTKIPIQHVADSMVIYDKHNLILFLNIDSTMIDINDLSVAFQALKKEHQGKIEIDHIMWITEQQLQYAIQYHTNFIYSRLRNFLDKAGNFTDFL